MEPSRAKSCMTKEEATAFIGKKTLFYLEKWKSHPDTILTGWNWAAMFFGIEWMAYRKMYLEALVSIVIVTCISSGTTFLFSILNISIQGDFFGDCLRILIGVFGNMLYRNKALRTLNKIDTQDKSTQLLTLSQKGGVSLIAVVIVLLFELVLLL